MTVAGKSYQLDPYCSVAIKDVGDTSCDAFSPAQHSNSESSSNEFIYGVGVGILVLILVIVAVVIIFTLSWRKSKNAKYNIR